MLQESKDAEDRDTTQQRDKYHGKSGGPLFLLSISPKRIDLILSNRVRSSCIEEGDVTFLEGKYRQREEGQAHDGIDRL